MTGDPLSHWTFQKKVPIQQTEEYKGVVALKEEDHKYLNANIAIWANIAPSQTVFADQLKSASYTEGEKPNLQSVYSEKQFKAMHANCISLEQKPLSVDEMRILHEDYRREGTCRRALDFNAQIITGKRTDLEMAPTKGFATEKREREEIKQLNDDAYNLDLLDELATIDRNVGFNDRIREMLVQGKCFGRSVLVKQCDDYGVPIRVIPLASLKLGKVYIDSETWEFLGVEYLDFQGEKRILKSQDIIHYENADYHITPNSRYFGMSALEPVMHIAAALRVLQEVAVPEIGKSMWAQALDIYVPGVKSQEKMDFISASILPGKRWVHNYEAIVKELATKADLKGLNEAIVELTKMIFRTVGVPLVVAYQDEQNRATAQAAINIAEATVAENDRTRLRNVLEPQWYVPNLLAVMRRRSARKGIAAGQGMIGDARPSQDEILQTQYKDIGVVNALERSNRILEIDPQAVALPFYPKMVFRPLEIDTFLERTAATLAWVNAGGLTIPMGLEVGGLSQYREAMELVLKEKEEKEALLLKMEMEMAARSGKLNNNLRKDVIGNGKDEEKKSPFNERVKKSPSIISKSAIPDLPVSTRQTVSPSDLIRG